MHHAICVCLGDTSSDNGYYIFFLARDMNLYPSISCAERTEISSLTSSLTRRYRAE
jgi:hypothetical protein